MNRKEAAELLPIIKAFAEGKEIEIFDKTKKCGKQLYYHILAVIQAFIASSQSLPTDLSRMQKSAGLKC